VAVTSSTRRAVYSGNGLVSTFSFPFLVFDPTQVACTISSAVVGQVELTYGTDFTVSVNGALAGPGGTVTLANALPAGYTLTIISALPFLQEAAISSAGGFWPGVINPIIDYLAILSQQLLDMIQNPTNLPALQRISYAETFSVTGTAVHITFPSLTFATAPTIYICVNGNNSAVSWVLNQTVVGAASYYTSMDITFAAGAVGLQFSLIVVSNG